MLDDPILALQAEFCEKLRLPCKLAYKRDEVVYAVRLRLTVTIPGHPDWVGYAEGATPILAARNLYDRAYREIHLCVEDEK